jgi:hypothetical protein
VPLATKTWLKNGNVVPVLETSSSIVVKDYATSRKVVGLRPDQMNEKKKNSMV